MFHVFYYGGTYSTTNGVHAWELYRSIASGLQLGSAIILYNDQTHKIEAYRGNPINVSYLATINNITVSF